jgi:RNA-directed DNA polymerase
MNKKPLEVAFNAMYHGKYDFHDFAEGDISGDYEEIEVGKQSTYKPKKLVLKTNKKLKAYHAFLNRFLFEYLLVNNRVVFSYRKGVNVYDAVSKHAANRYFFQTDIVSFFKSLDAELVRTAIRNSIDLIPISDIEAYLNRVVELVTVGNLLPVGFSTSPLISNSCLFDFDNKLESYCSSKGLAYTRYSDDIIVSSHSRENLSRIDEIVEAILKESFGEKLCLNFNKSRFTHIGNKVKLLGMVILPTGKVTIDKRIKNDIETKIYAYINDSSKFLLLADGDINKEIERISGSLNYINTVDKPYLDKLRKKYGATIVDMFFYYESKK